LLWLVEKNETEGQCKYINKIVLYPLMSFEFYARALKVFNFRDFTDILLTRWRQAN